MTVSLDTFVHTFKRHSQIEYNQVYNRTVTNMLPLLTTRRNLLLDIRSNLNSGHDASLTCAVKVRINKTK